MNETPLQSMHIRVECRPGHRGEPIPLRFYLGDSAIEVVEIVDRWVGQDHRYFKVQSANRDLYILRHDLQAQGWELTLFSREDYLIGAQETGTQGRRAL